MTKKHHHHANSSTLLKRLWRDYLRHYIGYYMLAVIFMVIVGACNAAIVYMVAPALDQALTGDEHILWLIAFGFFAISVIRGCANYVQLAILQYIGTNIIERLQQQMFYILQYLDMAFFHGEGTASQLSRFSNDVHFLNQAVSKVFTSAGRDIITLIFMIGVLLHHHIYMGLAVITLFPCAIYPVIVIGRKIRRISSDIQQQLSQMIAALDDGFKGAKLVRAYGLEQWQIERANKLFRKARALNFKSTLIRSLTQPFMDTILGIAMGGILLWGGYIILDGEMTSGQFMSFFVAIIAAYQPVRSLSTLNSYVQEGLAAADRIFTLIDTRPFIDDTHINDNNNAASCPVIKGDIYCNNISFSYGDNVILRQLNAHIEAEKITALVGPSGGGKTTILNILLRFIESDDGTILIDGQPINTIALQHLRNNIALVTQEAGIFDVSVRQNIGFGCMDATEEAIIKAAKDAHIHDDIMALPHGYDTQVGELGSLLSGGQRQRVALARALLRKAPIMLLDEATSALDTHNEQAIMATLFDYYSHGDYRPTIIIVAHRLSTISHADTILVINDGQVYEQGTHETLYNKNGLYADLCRHQFME